MITFEMKNDNTILVEKQRSSKKTASWSSKIDKYKHLTVEEILPPGQSRNIKQPKFTYFPLEKVLKKRKKQLKIKEKEKDLKMLNLKVLNELKNVLEMELKIDSNKMFHQGHRNAYNFLKDKAVYAFANDIINGDMTMDKADK